MAKLERIKTEEGERQRRIERKTTNVLGEREPGEAKIQKETKK